MTIELGTSIRNDGQQNLMKTHKLINLDSCILLGRISILNGDKVGTLGQSVHNNPYRILLPSGSR